MYQESTSPDQISIYGGDSIAFGNDNNTLVSVTTTSDALWKFNMDTNTWSSSNSSKSTLLVSRHSAHAQAPQHDLVFYLDVEGLVVRNTSAGTVRQIEGTSLPGGSSRIGAELQYISDMGTKGVLILIGGGALSMNQTSNLTTIKLVRNPLALSYTANLSFLIGLHGNYTCSRCGDTRQERRNMVRTANDRANTRAKGRFLSHYGYFPR